MASEKEYNGILFDQLHILRRLRKVAEEYGYDKMLDAISEEEADIKEKLYQRPPLGED